MLCIQSTEHFKWSTYLRLCFKVSNPKNCEYFKNNLIFCDYSYKMKIKRYKKVHRYVNFYANNFGFRKPYQILVDGTFCYAALNVSLIFEKKLKTVLKFDSIFRIK